MSGNSTLIIYGELGVLKLCVGLEDPFYTIPLVTAKKHGESRVFGKPALEKDETWEVTWLKGGEAQKGKFMGFFFFVFQQSEVQERVEECKFSVVVIDPALSPNSIEPQLSWSTIHVNMLPARLRVRILYGGNTSLLRFERDGMDRALKLDVLGDFTCSGYTQWRGRRYSNSGVVTVGFDTIVNLFIKLLCEKGYDFTVAKDRLLCYNLVMDCCYVALDFDKEMERIEKLDEPLHEITMEDGTVLELGKECIVAPEVLFNPGLAGIDEDGIMSLFRIYDVAALSALPPLILSGGCATSLNGLSERIQKEFTKGKNVDLQIMKSNPKEDALRWHEWLICTEFGS